MRIQQLAIVCALILNFFYIPLDAVDGRFAAPHKSGPHYEQPPSRALEAKRTLLPPQALICSERADVMAKYIYAKLREWEVNSHFGLAIYFRHIQVFNNFYEYDPPKSNFEDFLYAFHDLLDSIKSEGYKNGFSGIPIGINGIPGNGGHRMAACLLYNQPLITEQMPYKCDSWGFEYFRGIGLEEKYLDAMAIQYCELKPNTFLMLLFPSIREPEDKFERIIEKHAKIVYKKQTFLTESGGFNLILTAYENDTFVREGKTENYKTAKMKAAQCFPPGIGSLNPLKIYLLESRDLAAIKACKKEIRATVRIGHSSVHATDNHSESIILARTLFNKNSLDNLNRGKMAHTPRFDAYLEKYKQWLKADKQREEWCCVDSSAVLAAYGLRDCQDLDFLHHGNEQLTTDIEGVDDHNAFAIHHALPVDEILFDPDNHFFYRGVKFCALPIIREMKHRRGEAKDFADIALIDTL